MATTGVRDLLVLAFILGAVMNYCDADAEIRYEESSAGSSTFPGLIGPGLIEAAPGSDIQRPHR